MSAVDDEEFPDPADAVVDELKEQIDVGKAVTGGGIQEQIDGAKLGRAVGRSVGAAAGRRLGRAVGRRVDDLLQADQEGERSRLGRVVHAVATATAKTLNHPEYREPIGDVLRTYVGELDDRLGADKASEAVDEAAGAAEEGIDEAEGTAEEARETAEEGTPDASEALSGTGAEALPDDLGEVKRETYRNLLEVMSYEDLQSVAKEVGVRANQKRDDMIDDIVEQFAESGDAAADESDGSSDAESGDNTESGDGTESDENGGE